MKNLPKSNHGLHHLFSPRQAARRPDAPPFIAQGKTRDFDLSQPYIRVFEQRLVRNKERVAVSFKGHSLTYRELDRDADRIASYLLECGVAGNAIVAVCAERIMELAAVLLGVFKAGCVYLPIEPGRYPPERLRHILADARVEIVIDLDSRQRHNALFREQNRHVISLPEDAARLAGVECSPPATAPEATDTAYLIYTSGTTGVPKGVMVSQRNLLNHNFGAIEAYQLGENDRVLQCCALGFDLSLEEIFPTWLCGATLVLSPFGLMESPVKLLDFVDREKITLLNLPTAYWHELVGVVSEHPLPDSVRLVVIGGEKASEDHFRRWRELVPHVKLINAYGPTETTITATLGEKAETIGRPIANTYAYVLDHDMQPIPQGEEGELYIGGACVSKGYLNQPEKTAEVFLDNPFRPGEKIYRTGDLARFTADGEIVFIGRADNQIKLRGFRIELGDIEAALNRHPSVDNSIVILREDNSVQNLAAYVVPAAEKIDTAALHAFLEERVPSYMIPHTITVISEIPLNANGKADRGALPKPEPGVGGTPPETPTEKLLASIWHRLLRQEYPGIDDNFFMSGGHSLLATGLCLEIERRTGIQLPIHAVFENPTIRTQAVLVDTMLSTSRPRRQQLARFVGERKRFPATVLQRAMWTQEKMSENGNLFNLPMTAYLDGPVKPELLEQAINAVVAENENLRTAFETNDGILWQTIDDGHEVVLPVDDFSGLDEAARAAGCREIIEQERTRRFDFSSAPLFSLRLLKLNEQRFQLLFNAHHLIIDGWGISLFFQKLGEAYTSLAKGETPAAEEPAIQYGDYALWQIDWLKSGVVEEQCAYWDEKLKTVVPMPSLPFELPAPPGNRETAARYRFAISEKITSALKKIAGAEDCTLFMVLTALLQVQMHKYTGILDLTTGTVVANRRTPGTEDIMGLFVNTLALRNRLSPEESFRSFLRQVKETTLEAYHHQDTPFSEMLRRQPLHRHFHRELFSVSLLLHNMPSGERKFADVEMRCEELDYPSAAVKILIALEERNGELVGHCEYMEGLFNRESIHDMVAALIGLTEQVAAGPEAGATIRQLSCLPPRHSRPLSCFIAGETGMAIVCAEKLRQKGFYLRGVFSGDSRIQQWAMEANIPAYPAGADNMHLVMSAVDFDFLFSIIYSYIIPEKILRLPRREAINYHDSLLPTYAGINASAWVIVNREKKHGITWHRMTAEVDAGDILVQKEFLLESDEPVGHLNIKCAEYAIAALDELVDGLLADRIVPQAQDLSKRSYYGLHMRPPAGCLIDWSKDATAIAALVRAMDFSPGENQFGAAKILFRESFFAVKSAIATGNPIARGVPGTVVEFNDNFIVVVAGDRTGVQIDSIYALDGTSVDLATFVPGESVVADKMVVEEVDALCKRTTPHEQFWVKRFRTLVQPEAPLTEVDDTSTEECVIELSGGQAGYSSLAAFALFIARLTGLESFDLPLEPAVNRLNNTAASLFFPVVPLRICVSVSDSASTNLEKLEKSIAKTVEAGGCLLDIRQRYKQLNFFHQFPFRLKKAGATTLLHLSPGITCPDLLERYRIFLENLAKNQERRLAETALLSEAEFQRQIYDWNATRRDFDLSRPYIRVFEQRLARNKERVAVRFKGHSLTYDELNRDANRIASYLLECGVAGNAIVAVCAERIMELAAVLLGVFKAGCVYLPIEPGRYPPERLRHILADARVEIVIDLDSRQRHNALFREQNRHVISLPEDAARLAGVECSPPATAPEATDTAYLIYTSGTTGAPKGVMVSQRNLLNHNFGVIEAYQLGENDRVLQCGALGFDLSLEEIFPTWLCGATLVLSSYGLTESPARLLKLVDREKITLLNLPTAYWHELVGAIHEHPLPDSVRLVVIGGEKASEDHFRRWRELAPEVKVINTYGPTETTIIATLSETANTIGRPVANAYAYILDRGMQPVPPRVTGELYIGGECVSYGYLNKPQKNARAFPDNPFCPGEKMYRTGDLARFTAAGEIVFIGRADNQVKLRGFRIELGDIEIALKKHTAVDNAAVVLREDGAIKSLAAYVVPAAGKIDAAALRAFLEKRMPSYMIPRTITAIPEIPLNANGKVDYRALPVPFELQALTAPMDAEPREVDSPQELQIAILFQDILGIRDLDYNVGFFDLGGDSLGAVRLCLELEKNTGKQLSMDKLYHASSVKELARHLSLSSDSREKWSSLVLLRSGGSHPPLYLIHTTPGDILGYVNLVGHLHNRPVYGLQAYGLNLKHEPHDTVETMAKYYCELIVGHNPTGPYLLCGWCFGGIVAFEMAQRLRRQGRNVGFVGLIETWGTPRRNLKFKLNRLWNFWCWGPKGWKEYVKHKIRTRSFHEANDARLDYIAERFADSRSKPELERMRELYAINMRVPERYAMTRYPGVINVFQLSDPDNYQVIPDRYFGWRGLADEIRICRVPGKDHRSVLKPPYVGEVAAKLMEALLDAEKKDTIVRH